MIVTQIRIYRVDIEDSGSLEGRGSTIDGYYCHHKLPAAATQEYYHPSVLFLTPHLHTAGGRSKLRSRHTSVKSVATFNLISRKQDNGFAKLLHFYFLKGVKYPKRRCTSVTGTAKNCALRKKQREKL